MLKADRVTGTRPSRIRRLTRTEGQTMSQDATDLLSLVSEAFPGAEAEQRRLASQIIAPGVADERDGC
jgi:hypothetical protein